VPYLKNNTVRQRLKGVIAQEQKDLMRKFSNSQIDNKNDFIRILTTMTDD